jgi:hypothetical protein
MFDVCDRQNRMNLRLQIGNFVVLGNHLLLERHYPHLQVRHHVHVRTTRR